MNESLTRPRLAGVRRAGLPLLLLTTLCATQSLAGSLTTRDGKTLQGTITPAGNTTIQIDAAGLKTTIQTTQLLRVTFTDTPPATQPIAWQHQDIGKLHVRGDAMEADGKFTLTASGWGAWGTGDGCHFLYWPLEGDGQIIAHVAAHGDDRAGAIAGVMMRDAIAPDANFAAATVYPSGEARFTRRPVPEGYLAPPIEGHPVAVTHEWVRLTRIRDTIAAYRSQKGVYWEPMTTKNATLSGKLLVGLIASSTNNSYLVPATFDHVRLIPGTPARTYFDGAVGPAAGVVMVDGTLLAGHVESFEKEKVRFLPNFDNAGQKTQRPKNDEDRKTLAKQFLLLPPADVARLRLAPEPPDLASITHGQSGILLVTGDYLEGEIERFAYGQYLDLNSVLFGTKRFEAHREVICAVLHQVGTEAAPCEIRTRDGSIVKAKSIRFDGDYAMIDAPSVGSLKFPVSELLSVEWRK